MKIRKAVSAPWRGLKSLAAMRFRPATWRSLRIQGNAFDYLSEVGDGTASSAVMAPLLWIARNFPEAPPQIQREEADGTLENEPKHDMLRLLVRPNDFYSGVTMWMATMLDYNADGNAYWIKIRDKGGRVVELWWTPSSMITPVGGDEYGDDPDAFISGYRYSPGIEPVYLPNSEVVHFRYGLDPENPRKGVSPLKSVLREVFTDDEAATFTAQLLRNSGVPGLVISPEAGQPAPDEDDVIATRDYVKSSHTGSRRGEPIVMSGPTKVEQFGFSPAQLDLRALRRVPEERITGVIGVPAIVAGLGAGLDRSTFANFAEAREAAYQENIMPAHRAMGEELRFQLLADFEQDPWDFRVGFDTSNVRVLQEDEDKRAQRLDVGVRGGWIRVAEARREMGHPVEKADDVYLRSFATLEVPAGQEGRTLATEPAADDPPAPATEPKAKARLHKAAPATADLTRLIVRLERELPGLAKTFADGLEDDFQMMGSKAAAVFTQIYGDDMKSADSSSNTKRLKALDDATDEGVANAVIGQMNLSDWIETEGLKPRYENHYKKVATSIVSAINSTLDIGVNLPDHVMRQVVAKGGTRLALLETTKDTQEAIIRAVAAGRADGEGPIQIARRIASEVPKGRFVNAGSGYRAELIARTETKYAQNVSSLATYGEAETITAVIAFDARLGDSDPDCEARDGQTFTFEQAEIELANEHPNGTLSFAPVVADSLDDLEG